MQFPSPSLLAMLDAMQDELDADPDHQRNMAVLRGERWAAEACVKHHALQAVLAVEGLPEEARALAKRGLAYTEKR